MKCRTVEGHRCPEKHCEHAGSEGVKRVGVWMWVVEHEGSECKHMGLEYEHVGSANEVEYQDPKNEQADSMSQSVDSKNEHVDSLVREGAGGIHCLQVQQ